jgi:hypothetical protein
LIKDVNIRPETLKQIQETVGYTLEQIGIGNDFLNCTQKGSSSKRNNEQMGLYQTKELWHSKRNITRLKRQPTNWKESFHSTHTIRD